MKEIEVKYRPTGNLPMINIKDQILISQGYLTRDTRIRKMLNLLTGKKTAHIERKVELGKYESEESDVPLIIPYEEFDKIARVNNIPIAIKLRDTHEYTDVNTGITHIIYTDRYIVPADIIIMEVEFSSHEERMNFTPPDYTDMQTTYDTYSIWHSLKEGRDIQWE